MAFDPITPAQFKAAKPQFSGVDNSRIENYIALAVLLTDEGWPNQGISDQANIAMVCHLMTLDGLGSDNESNMFLTGGSNMQSIKSGSVTITRFQSNAVAQGHDTRSWFGTTTCGQFYSMLAKKFRKPAARWIMGGVNNHAVSGYAKDGSWWW